MRTYVAPLAQRSRGRAEGPEGAEHLVQVGGDDDLVVEEVAQPDVVVPVGQGHQRQQLAQADADAGRLSLRVGGRLGRGVDAEMWGHARSSLSRRAVPVEAPWARGLSEGRGRCLVYRQEAGVNLG